MDEITYPFPKLNSEPSKFGFSKFFQHFSGHVIINPCWDLSYFMLVKGTHGIRSIHLFNSYIGQQSLMVNVMLFVDNIWWRHDMEVGPLWRESINHRRIPRASKSRRRPLTFSLMLAKYIVEQTVDMSVNWVTTTLTWRHYNVAD